MRYEHEEEINSAASSTYTKYVRAQQRGREDQKRARGRRIFEKNGKANRVIKHGQNTSGIFTDINATYEKTYPQL
jgi:hypothetical protein